MAMNMKVLFYDDFADLPVGVIGGNYTPDGEYHVVGSLADTGRWRETMIHYSFRTKSRGNWQIVLENDGTKALEETINAAEREPMIAAGDVSWRDIRMDVEIRPLTAAASCSVLFRYRHARQYYAFAFDGGTVRLIRKRAGESAVLGESACRLDPDRYVPVSLDNDGNGIRLMVDGRDIMSFADKGAQAWAEGSIGLAAKGMTRFARVRVSTSATNARRIQEEGEKSAIILADLRKRHPVPKVWKKIETPAYGSDRNLRIGDINGDGLHELVFARRTDRLGTDDAATITSLAAFDLGGNLLWTYGEPGSTDSHTTMDLPFQVHDIYGDGKARVVFCKDWELLIADGVSGRIERAMALPCNPDKAAENSHRIFGDCLYFADLTGSGRKDCTIIKDRYRHVFAYDSQWRLLWRWSGNTGHYPMACDMDGDGKDEVLTGYSLIDHDGTVLWTHEIFDHMDSIMALPCGALGIEGGGSSWRIYNACSDAGFRIFDEAGKQLSHYPVGHGQSLCVANLMHDRPGVEIMVNTFWGEAGIVSLYAPDGRFLRDYEPMNYACLLQPANWAPLAGGAAPGDLVLLSTHPRQGGLIDGYGRRLVMFPDDGHPVLCNDARDIDGDGIDEVLTWDERELWIYKADVEGRNPSNYPLRNPWFNDSNYRGQVSLYRG